MSTFEAAIPTVLRHEGGYVNDPDDRGGETNFGISMKMITDEGITAARLGLPDLEPGSLKNLTIEKAISVYRDLFWERQGYGRIDDQHLATKVFDCAVNCGPTHANQLIQRAANDCGRALDDDGKLGPISIKAINECSPGKLYICMCAQMERYYHAIVARHPEQVKFLSNWLMRAAQ